MPVKSLNYIDKTVHNRDKLILEKVKGKKVVHYGCAGDAPSIIDRRIKNGNYIHSAIMGASRDCIGVDMNRENIRHLAENHGIRNIHYGNIEDPTSFECDHGIFADVDLVLLPDVIEHLNNPGNMVQGLLSLYPKTAKVVITTPNPLTYENILAALGNKEIYNSHHTCYFSTNNMEVLLSRYGVKIRKVHPFWVSDRGDVSPLFPFGWRSLAGLAGSVLFRFSPHICDGYMYECELP